MVRRGFRDRVNHNHSALNHSTTLPTELKILCFWAESHEISCATKLREMVGDSNKKSALSRK